MRGCKIKSWNQDMVGWINTDLFKGWLVEHFVQYAVPGHPLLLLLDGHFNQSGQKSVTISSKKNPGKVITKFNFNKVFQKLS